MKYKSRFRAAVIGLAVWMALLFCLPAGSVSYNDEWVAGYENMKEQITPVYTVPTLFKNDAAFGNNRRFPLVVQNRVEYVPLEMFSGLSGISVNAGYSPTNFYITNSKNKSFISFDAENDLVTTQDLQTYELSTKLFYDTRYVPAAQVAQVLGIGVEIYDSPEDGVYALRFTDGKQKLSFAEVIKMYSPIKKTEATAETKPEETKPDPQPDSSDKTGEQETVPDMEERTVYLSADVTDYIYLDAFLSALEQERTACAFFVSPGDILTHADGIRQILTAGHPVGLLLGKTNPEEEYQKGLENLYLIAKCTTRLVRFSGGSRSTAPQISDEAYKSFVEKNGLCVWDYNISVADSAGMYDTLYHALYSLRRSYGTKTAVIRLLPGRNSGGAITKYAALLRQKPQLSPAKLQETAEPISYRRIP